MSFVFSEDPINLKSYFRTFKLEEKLKPSFCSIALLAFLLGCTTLNSGSEKSTPQDRNASASRTPSNESVEFLCNHNPKDASPWRPCEPEEGMGGNEKVDWLCFSGEPAATAQYLTNRWKSGEYSRHFGEFLSSTPGPGDTVQTKTRLKPYTYNYVFQKCKSGATDNAAIISTSVACTLEGKVDRQDNAKTSTFITIDKFQVLRSGEVSATGLRGAIAIDNSNLSVAVAKTQNLKADPKYEPRKYVGFKRFIIEWDADDSFQRASLIIEPKYQQSATGERTLRAALIYADHDQIGRSAQLKCKPN